MANVTMDKINKINAKLKNGFTVDVMLALRGDKQYSKEFKMPDGRLARASIFYLENYKTYNKEIYPVVNFNYIRKERGFEISSGLGWTMKLQNTPVERKTEKMLADFTNKLDDESCINFMAGLTSNYKNMMA